MFHPENRLRGRGSSHKRAYSSGRCTRCEDTGQRAGPSELWAGIRIVHSKNVLVEGLITTQCPTGGSDSITIRNLKVISSYGWGDGLNVFASNNILFDGVFCRNSDDCTTVYGTRMGFTGGCKNITMQNSTLWADVAHPIFIGIHGNVENPEILKT